MGLDVSEAGGGHEALEREIAAFYGRRHAIVFTTGFAASMGMVAALAGPEDILLIDADSHASIYDGCRLSGAEILRFRHNDPADLAKRLRRLGERAASLLVLRTQAPVDRRLAEQTQDPVGMSGSG